MDIVGAFGAEGRWFDSTSSRHASPSPVIACMTDVAPCGCLAAKFDSCNSLLSSVHTLLVNILRCVRLLLFNENIIVNVHFHMCSLRLDISPFSTLANQSPVYSQVLVNLKYIFLGYVNVHFHKRPLNVDILQAPIQHHTPTKGTKSDPAKDTCNTQQEPGNLK